MLKRLTEDAESGLWVGQGACAGCAENWIENGYLPAIRIGRRVRVKRSDFDALLEASYTGNKQPPAGVWEGDVPAPVAPGEHDDREASPPDASSDS